MTSSKRFVDQSILEDNKLVAKFEIKEVEVLKPMSSRELVRVHSYLASI